MKQSQHGYISTVADIEIAVFGMRPSIFALLVTLRSLMPTYVEIYLGICGRLWNAIIENTATVNDDKRALLTGKLAVKLIWNHKT